MAEGDFPVKQQGPFSKFFLRVLTELWDGVTQPIRDLYDVPQAYLRSLITSTGDTVAFTLFVGSLVTTIAMCALTIRSCSDEVHYSHCRVESYTVDMQTPASHITRLPLYRVVGAYKYKHDVVLSDRIDTLDDAVASANKLGCGLKP